MTDTRVLIVDDEPLGRERLRSFLARESGITLAAECSNGTEAVEAIRRDPPDVVFLDVQMPGLSGFDVLERLGNAMPSAVIFVTAHDQFALKAFEVHAVDYLLKPFDRARFQIALNRALERVRARRPEALTEQITSLLADLKAGAPPPERIPVKHAGRVTFVNIPDLDWVASADNYVELHAGGQCHLLRETLTALASRLPSGTFVRISRTTIVNVSRVKELQPLFHGDYAVILKDGTRLTLSRSHRDQLPRLGLG